MTYVTTWDVGSGRQTGRTDAAAGCEGLELGRGGFNVCGLRDWSRSNRSDELGEGWLKTCLLCQTDRSRTDRSDGLKMKPVYSKRHLLRTSFFPKNKNDT